MENLLDDLVLEIIFRLPIKYAVRCSILNKRFDILVQKFQHENIVRSNTKVCNHVYFSSWYPDFLLNLRLDPPYNPTKYKTEVCKYFNDGSLTLLSSCGLLLLKLNDYCVFNPITGEYQFVPRDRLDDGVGLAVDHSGRYRLVAIQSKTGRVEKEILFKFRIFTASSSAWEDAHEEYLPYDWRCRDSPVYSHGSLHWLIQDNKILSFDLGKRRARVFEGRLPCTPNSNWFGVAQGSLVYINADKYEIVIYVYDHIISEWRVHQKIRNLENQHEIEACHVKFFSGERLVILVQTRYRKGQLYIYDISSKSWKKFGMMRDSFIWGKELVDQFIPFIPTTAKVYSGLYVNDKGYPDHCWIVEPILQPLVNVFKTESD